MNSFWVLAGIAVCVSGCLAATVETTHLNLPPHPLVSRPAQSVEVYSSSAPTRPHVDVALLRADQSNFGTDTPLMVQSLVERAGELGCDALFISGASERAGGTPGNPYYLLDPGSHELFATCIAYLPQAPAGTFAGATSGAPPAGNAIIVVLTEQQKGKVSAIAINGPGHPALR